MIEQSTKASVWERYEGLLRDIEAFMSRYVKFPSDDHKRIVAVYVLHTWLFEVAQTTPYLYVTGEKASGKTRLLDVLTILTRNARRADDMTPAVMLRLIELETPTLLIDEVDTIWSGSRNEPKRRLLNTGYKLGGVAYREAGRQVVKYPTFTPKVLAGIRNGFLPDTVLDRCIPVTMVRKSKGDPIERFNEYQVSNGTEVESILERIWQFKEEAYVDVSLQYPLPLAALSDRQNEIVEPLLAIANVLGVEAELRASFQRVFRETGQQQSPRQIALGRIRDAFGDRQKVYTEELCRAMGPSWNGRQLGLFLEPYGVAPTDIRTGTRVAKGYKREDFEDVWEAYLDPVGPQLVEADEQNDDDERMAV